MKESQIIQTRIEALEAELATARQVLTEVTREEAVTGSVEERREYAETLYRKILCGYDDNGYDVDSDAADDFIRQVVSQEEIDAITEGHGALIYGSLPIIQACKAETLTAIIAVLETCIDYIEDNYVLDTWLNYDPVTCIITEGYLGDDDEE
jgi:hypothetical protein